ncbi:MAG: hypothetical protein Q9225_001048 [Loekoesia sp. 1 TL-2023]
MNASLPALPPPAGMQANFENPQSRAYLTVIPCAAIVGLMIIFVFIRMYTKVYILKAMGWDDYTCLFAAVGCIFNLDVRQAHLAFQLSSVVFLGFLMALYELGFGVHQWNISHDYLMALLSKEGKSLSALWGPTMFFTKLSLLLLYYRIFAPDRVTKFLIFFGIFYCFILYTSFLPLSFLLCQSFLRPSCAHQWNLFLLISSGLNVASDVYLLVIPLAAVAKLQMPTKQKLEVSAVFFAGMLACLSGILALYYRTQLLYTQDLTWHFTPVFVFTVMEINTGIIVSCMPTMPALIQDIRSQVSSSTRQTASRRSLTRTHTVVSRNSRNMSSHQKKTSSNSMQRQVRFDVPNRHPSPVELDSTPVQMEEAYVVEPRSYFSDDSSEGEQEYGWLS